jgi:hypothetical protein
MDFAGRVECGKFETVDKRALGSVLAKLRSIQARGLASVGSHDLSSSEKTNFPSHISERNAQAYLATS